jgi:hypothetical protein
MSMNSSFGANTMIAGRIISALAAALLAAGCSDSSSGPKDTACKAETSSVDATVQAGSSVIFDWTPSCPVALLLVEQDGGDQWVIAAPNFSETSTESANVIARPVTYGQVPAGAEENTPAAQLVVGQSYTLVLWRMVPPGSNVQCQQRFQNACLIAVKAFTR